MMMMTLRRSQGRQIDFTDIRRLVIVAMFSDDTLFDRLTLKGGNALNLIYKFGMRSSLDVDLSLEQDFEHPEDSGKRILQGLSDRFAEVGIIVFDYKFGKRPLKDNPDSDKWGGYEAEFKLAETDKYNQLKDDMDRVRRESLVIGDDQQRVFRVQISKHEYCGGKVERNLDHYAIYVYTPEMIVIEKLRAICQQMPEYPQRRYAAARARDFYDIFSTVEGAHIEVSTPQNLELVQHIFAAKSVPLPLLAKIKDFREFHRPDWASVELTAAEKLKPFDFYFDFVLQQVELLKPLWEI